MRSLVVERLVRYWQMLSPATLVQLGEIYSNDVYFRDPFNEVHGLDNVRQIFGDMFVRLHEPRFRIIETIEQDNAVMLIWDFDFRIKSMQPDRSRQIHGSSHIRFAADGKVEYHRDYWDAAGELYEHLPVVGGLMRWLKRRMA